MPFAGLETAGKPDRSQMAGRADRRRRPDESTPRRLPCRGPAPPLVRRSAHHSLRRSGCRPRGPTSSQRLDLRSSFRRYGHGGLALTVRRASPAGAVASGGLAARSLARMATYAIGDVHGCFVTLRALLARCGFSPRQDRLWMVGDLVNRGPRSLEVLRWAAAMGDRLVVVLGNHDLYLLARAAGLAKRKRRDTLDAVLEAADGDELVSWLRARPLLHREGDRVLVHAGLFPQWSAEAAERLARETEEGLRGRHGDRPPTSP